jgi:hypothetical protein
MMINKFNEYNLLINLKNIYQTAIIFKLINYKEKNLFKKVKEYWRL